MYILNDREVEVIETDFEMGEGVQVIEAVFLDNEEPLTEAQCQELTDMYQSDLYDAAYEHASARAYDDAKDFMKYGE